MNRKFIVFIVLLFAMSVNYAFSAETLEARIARELSRIKGVKMCSVTFNSDNNNITSAHVSIRAEKNYKLTEIQKVSIVNFVVYSSTNLSTEDVSLKVTYEPIVALSSDKIKYKTSSTEDKIAKTLAQHFPAKEIYVNIVRPDNNFVGDFNGQARVAILLKLSKKYEYDDKDIFSVVDFLMKSVKNLSYDGILIIDQEGNTIFQFVEE